MKRIVISGGYYATNIGNAFYEIGAKYILENILGKEAEIILSSDKLEIYWSSLLRKGTKSFDYTSTYIADYVVILGPMLSSSYLKLWDETFTKLTRNGTKIVFMSAGANDYNNKEYDEVSAFLRTHKLHALISRDSETYQLYKDFFEYSYDGICCALYCCDYAPKYKLDTGPYVILNFDNCDEPLVVASPDGNLVINGHSYELRHRNPIFNRRYPDFLGDGERIIRTVHTVMPDLIRKKAGQGYYLSDCPYDYLNLYANATAVLTNRVHAAVASIAYGTPVHLTNDSPRGNIFRRINCQDIHKTLIVADKNIIDCEKAKLEEAIREVFA